MMRRDLLAISAICLTLVTISRGSSLVSTNTHRISSFILGYKITDLWFPFAAYNIYVYPDSPIRLHGVMLN
jgi:hypothetical protein